MKRIPVPPRLDMALAGAVGILAITEIATNAAVAPRTPSLFIELTLAGAVAWRRAAPLSAAVVVALGVAADAAVGVPPSEPAVPPVASVILLYSLVSYVEMRRAFVGSLVLVAAATAQVLIAGQPLANLFFIYGVLGFAWAFGRIVRLRTSQAVTAERAVAQLHREHEDERRRVVEEERSRIARELHDVIAHSVSVMVVQAGAARQVLTRDPEGAAHALDQVQVTGRQAIAELARLLGVLRDAGRDDREEIGLAPQPTLAQLPDLIRAVDAAGPRVSLSVTGTPRPMPSGLELTVYRIVQEALTNTRKHAGSSSHASVLLEYAPDRLAVEVTDDAREAHGARAGSGTGHGLVGVRERVISHGGRLEVGHIDGRGFRLRADLPLGEQL